MSQEVGDGWTRPISIAAVPSGYGRLALLFAVTCATLVDTTTPAAAQFFFDSFFKPKYYRPSVPIARAQRPRRSPAIASLPSRRSPRIQEDAERPSSAPLLAVVSLEDQHVSIYGSQGLIERENVSTGTTEHPTPTGIFAVIQKERWHESNIYSGAPMPFMQRLTWSGVAMHAGQLPGYPASHGCIRLTNDFAQRWFSMTRPGLRVVISPSDVAPEPITHSNLPMPRRWASVNAVVPQAPVQSAGLSNETFASLATPKAVELNPITYAIEQKAIAKAELKLSEQTESQTGDALEAANRALKAAIIALKVADREATAAEKAKLSAQSAALKAAAAALPPDELHPAPAPPVIPDDVPAKAALAQAQAREAASRVDVAVATAAVRAADQRTEYLKQRITEMTRRQEPLSIFVSLKDARVYVRQAMRPVMDAPIDIKDPELTLGNHVFTAESATEPPFRWSVVTLPVEQPRIPKEERQVIKAKLLESGSIAQAIPSESAAGALSRITLPLQVQDLLAERVWVGASFIISDHALGDEIIAGSDFVVETRHP